MWWGGMDGSGAVSDVWRSTDGRHWQRLAAAAFTAREGLQVAAVGGTLWMAGGTVSGGVRNDVWRSTDGVDWSEVTQQAAFPARTGHQLVAFLNGLWVLGASGTAVDVWRSGDGARWTRAVTGGQGATSRSGHRVAAHGGVLWVVGGAGLQDFWTSTSNGIMWTQRSARGFSARTGHEAVSFNGSLLVVGGESAGGLVNDVWGSADGSGWAMVTPGGTVFPARRGHETAVYRGSLWVVGGRSGGGLGSDVWVSGDGAGWARVTDAAGFSPREGHQVAVFTSVPPGAYRVATVTATVTGAVTIFFDDVTPLTVATVAADGGVGELRFEVVGDVAGVASVGATSGVVVATAFPTGGARATVSIRVGDATPINAATVAVTLFRVPRLTVGRDFVELVMSPGFTGPVFKISAAGGVGVYSYSRVSGLPSKSRVDAETGVVALVGGGLRGGQVKDVVAEVRDGGGETASVTLRLRAATAGDMGAFMFLGGGDATAESGGGRKFDEVWRSRDGVNWGLLPVFSPGLFGRSGHQMVFHGGSLWLIGGGDMSDVWRSADGMGWTRVTVSAGFAGRSGHQAVSFGGSLWVIGGDGGDGMNLADVWRSADGEDWTQVAVSSPSWGARRGHEVAVFGGSLWVLGGRGESNGSTVYYDDVWRSADGGSWVSVSLSGTSWMGRKSHEVVSLGGSLWVVGGFDGTNNYGDVWRSGNGSVWVSTPISGDSWAARRSHQVVAFGGSLWVVGGFDGSRSYGDVWRSADGGSWTRVAVSSPSFAARRVHQVAVHEGPVPFVVEPMAVTLSGVGRRLTVDVGDALPLTLVTMTLSGGSGVARFSLLGDAATVATVEADGALVATNFVQGLATVSILVRDGTPVNQAVAVVTIAFVSEFRLGRDSVAYSFSPDFVGAAHTIKVSGGEGVVSFERVRGNSALTVDGAGVVAVVSPLPAIGSTVAVFAATDEGMGSLQFTMSLDVFVEGGRLSMYVVGGADIPNSAGEDDVWRSADGMNWDLVTDSAEWSGRRQHQVVSRGGTLWLMGGYGDGDSSSSPGFDDIWWSVDGGRWEKVEVSGSKWSGRRAHQAVSFGGYFWVIAGRGGGSSPNRDTGANLGDVWRSADGVRWEVVTTSKGRFSKRRSHGAVSFGGSLWVMGGDNVNELTDIWRSADGVDWELVAVSGNSWEKRRAHGVVSHDGKMWVVGGGEWKGGQRKYRGGGCRHNERTVRLWRCLEFGGWERLGEGDGFCSVGCAPGLWGGGFLSREFVGDGGA